MTKRKYATYVTPEMKHPSVQPVRWMLLKPTVHIHKQLININPFKNSMKIYANAVFIIYNLKLHSTWMPIFWYWCSRRRIFVGSFTNWGWWLRRSNIDNSQFALINLIAGLFIKLHAMRKENDWMISRHVMHSVIL